MSKCKKLLAQNIAIVLATHQTNESLAVALAFTLVAQVLSSGSSVAVMVLGTYFIKRTNTIPLRLVSSEVLYPVFRLAPV